MSRGRSGASGAAMIFSFAFGGSSSRRSSSSALSRLFGSAGVGADFLRSARGFCAVCSLEDIKKQDYVLTPGRYVGIAEAEDDGIPFEEKMKTLTEELSTLFAEDIRLQNEIREKLAGIGFNLKEV